MAEVRLCQPSNMAVPAEHPAHLRIRVLVEVPMPDVRSGGSSAGSGCARSRLRLPVLPRYLRMRSRIGFMVQSSSRCKRLPSSCPRPIAITHRAPKHAGGDPSCPGHMRDQRRLHGLLAGVVRSQCVATLGRTNGPSADDKPGHRHNGQTDKDTPKEVNRRSKARIHGAPTGARGLAMAVK